MAFCRFWPACWHHLNFLEPDLTQQLPDVEPDLDASATNNPIAMEAPALFDLESVVATPPALRLIGQYGASITHLLNWHQTG